MAVQRLSLSQIESAILEIVGYSSSANAPWGSSANLYLRVNEYGQRLPMHLNSLARQMNMPTPVRFDMWRNTVDSDTSGADVPLVSSGSQYVYLPVDYDQWVSFWDLTNSRPISVIENVDKWHSEILLLPEGPPQYIEIQGFVTDGSGNWRRRAKLYPATEAGTTPSFRMEYWKLPATMPGVSPTVEYPDIDPKYESIFIYGPICDLARNTGFEYDRYAALEKDLLIEMLSTARSL